jgi:hypothetical protein
MSFTQELSNCQSVPTFKMILTLHKKVRPICESLAKVLAIHSATATGRDECITEGILPILLDVLIEHPASMPLLTSIAAIIQQFSATDAGRNACTAAGCQDVLNAIST